MAPPSETFSLNGLTYGAGAVAHAGIRRCTADGAVSLSTSVWLSLALTLFGLNKRSAMSASAPQRRVIHDQFIGHPPYGRSVVGPAGSRTDQVNRRGSRFERGVWDAREVPIQHLVPGLRRVVFRVNLVLQPQAPAHAVLGIAGKHQTVLGQEPHALVDL